MGGLPGVGVYSGGEKTLLSLTGQGPGGVFRLKVSGRVQI